MTEEISSQHNNMDTLNSHGRRVYIVGVIGFPLSESTFQNEKHKLKKKTIGWEIVTEYQGGVWWELVTEYQGGVWLVRFFDVIRS